MRHQVADPSGLSARRQKVIRRVVFSMGCAAVLAFTACAPASPPPTTVDPTAPQLIASGHGDATPRYRHEFHSDLINVAGYQQVTASFRNECPEGSYRSTWADISEVTPAGNSIIASGVAASAAGPVEVVLTAPAPGLELPDQITVNGSTYDDSTGLTCGYSWYLWAER